MSRTEFRTMRSRNGTYMASLAAAACGITIAVVQLWIRSAS